MKLSRAILPVILILFCFPAFAQRALVFPFTQEDGGPSTEWIGTGLAVGLNEAMDRGKLGFVSLESLQRLYDQEGLVNSPDFSLPAQIGLARQIGVAYLISGTYLVMDKEIIARLSIYGVSKELVPLGTWEEKASLDSLLTITTKLSRHVFGIFNVPYKEGDTVPPAAFESYIRGRIVDDSLLKEVYFKRAVELDSDYLDARCHLALVLKKEGKVSKAAEILNGLKDKQFSKSYLALAALGDIELKEGKLKEAASLYLRSLKSGDRPEGHLGLARLYLWEGKYDLASKELVVVERFQTHLDEVDSLRESLEKRKNAVKAREKSSKKK